MNMQKRILHQQKLSSTFKIFSVPLTKLSPKFLSILYVYTAFRLQRVDEAAICFTDQHTISQWQMQCNKSISSTVLVFTNLGANYKKILRLSYDVIITYDNRKPNLR